MCVRPAAPGARLLHGGPDTNDHEYANHEPPHNPIGWPQEQALSDEIAIALRELRDVTSELRDQLAGTAKSHYTVEEIARMTGRATYTVRTWIKRGALRAERVAGTGPRGRRLIPRDEMRRLIAVGKGTDVPASVVRDRK